MKRGISNKQNKDVNICYTVGAKIAAWMEAQADSYFLEYEPVSFVTQTYDTTLLM
jgi:hypothetical protein